MMITFITTIVLSFSTLLGSEEESAEALFRKMEQKIYTANSFQFKFRKKNNHIDESGQKLNVYNEEGYFAVAKGGKFRFETKVSSIAGTKIYILMSDGKEMVFQTYSKSKSNQIIKDFDKKKNRHTIISKTIL